MPAALSVVDEEELRTVQQDADTGRPVRIRWIDSGLAVYGKWGSFAAVADQDRDVLDAETVGIWMGQNDRVVMIAHSRDEAQSNWQVSMVIYRPCITMKEWL